MQPQGSTPTTSPVQSLYADLSSTLLVGAGDLVNRNLLEATLTDIETTTELSSRLGLSHDDLLNQPQDVVTDIVRRRAIASTDNLHELRSKLRQEVDAEDLIDRVDAAVSLIRESRDAALEVIDQVHNQAAGVPAAFAPASAAPPVDPIERLRNTDRYEALGFTPAEVTLLEKNAQQSAATGGGTKSVAEDTLRKKYNESRELASHLRFTENRLNQQEYTEILTNLSNAMLAVKEDINNAALPASVKAQQQAQAQVPAAPQNLTKGQKVGRFFGLIGQGIINFKPIKFIGKTLRTLFPAGIGLISAQLSAGLMTQAAGGSLSSDWPGIISLVIGIGAWAGSAFLLKRK